ncbi:MAG: DUF421 domain-containing protein [Christensenellales bacterium]
MLIVFIRAIIIYFFLLIAMRLMGKKQLGELQPFEFAISLIVAELACIPMSDTQVPIVYGLVPIFTLFILEFIVTKMVKHSIKLRKVINGKPVIVITPQGIDYKAISSLDMTINDIMEALRAKSYLSPAEIHYAIVETNGDVSVIPKSANQPATLSDINVSKQDPQLPFTLICEGKKLTENIRLSGVGEKFVEDVLNKYGLKQKDVLLLSVAGQDEFYLQPIERQYITGNIDDLQEGVQDERN